MPRKNVTVTLVAYRNLTTPTHEMFMRELFHPQWGLSGSHGKYNVRLRALANDALISRSRSRALTHFWQSDCEVMFWCDADMICQPGDVLRLVDTCFEKKGIVSAIVPLRAFDSGHAVRFTKEVQDDENLVIWNGLDQVVPAHWVGSAFCAIHWTAVDAAARDCQPCHGPEGPHLNFCMPFHMPGDIPGGPGDGLSEDWAFTERCRRRDVPIWVDCKPVIEHLGPYAFSLEDVCAKPEGLDETV
jgi:hypothetical protein